MQSVAKIANNHPDFCLFFRGQDKDYKIDSGKSSCYPSIFRSPRRSLTGKILSERFEKLGTCSEILVELLEKRGLTEINKLKKFTELQWSILQHYEVCKTPLLDVTHSLRVAASFAYHGADAKGYKKGCILVYALPYPQGTITYSTEDELLNIRLLSACPSLALRPHFQEGFLVATFPSQVRKKRSSLDFGQRLVAKIEITINRFWDRNFSVIPLDALYPQEDEMELLCFKIKSNK